MPAKKKQPEQKPETAALAKREGGGAPAIPENILAEFSTAREAERAAAENAAFAVANAVVSGLELIRLHKKWGVRKGRPKKGEESLPAWDDLVKIATGMPETTARRRMQLGEGATKRSKVIRDLVRDGKPLNEMTPEDRERLLKATRHLAAESTLAALYSDWGIAKQRLAPPKGGARQGAGDDDAPDYTDANAASDRLNAAMTPLLELSQSPEWDALVGALPRIDAEADSDGILSRTSAHHKLTEIARRLVAA